MTTKLTGIRDRERRSTLWQIAIVDTVRHLTRAGASQLDCASTWAQIAVEAAERADRHARFAVEEGETFAEVARAIGVTRQAASKRYRHLDAVG